MPFSSFTPGARRLFIAVCAVSVSALLVACASPPARPTDLSSGQEAVNAYLARLIDHEMRSSSTPAMSIAIVDDQRVVWAQGFGHADVEQRIPATTRTLYRAGSISKLFTDIAALQLVEQSKLDLDAPVQASVPQFSVRQRESVAGAITPRQLMTHHSGLPRDRLKGFMTKSPEPITAVLNQVKDEYADYRPGSVLAYSNLGITVLGALVQEVSGTPFSQRLRQSVLDPLDMSASTVETGVSSSPLMAKGYQGAKPAVEPALRDVPAGGLNTSVDDLSHFMQMIFAGGTYQGRRILKPETIAEMFAPQNSAVPLDLNFQVGLGWMLSTLGRSTIQGGGVVAHHAGATRLFNSQMYLLPQHKLGVVVLANSSTARQSVDRVAVAALALQLQLKTGIEQPPFKPIPLADHSITEEARKELVGDYTTMAGHVRVFAQGSRLKADVGGHHFDLLARSDGLFALDYSLLGLLRLDLGPLSDVGLALRHIDGHHALVARVGSQEMLVGDKLGPPMPLAAWAQRLGNYEITNLGDDLPSVDKIRLREDRGYLVAEISSIDRPAQAMRTVLLPLSDREALALDVLNNAGSTVRVEYVDGEERLAFSGYQARRVDADQRTVKSMVPSP